MGPFLLLCSSQGSPFDSKPSSYSTSAKHSSPEAAASAPPSEEHQEVEQPGTPVPSEDLEASDLGTVSIIGLCASALWGMSSWCGFVSAEKTNALSEPREEESLTKKGKKKKTVHWPEEDQLKNYFYFDLDETERGEAGLRSAIRMLLLPQGFELQWTFRPSEMSTIDFCLNFLLFSSQSMSTRLKTLVKLPNGSWWWTDRRLRWHAGSLTTPWKRGSRGPPRSLWVWPAASSPRGWTAPRGWSNGSVRWESCRRSSWAKKGSVQSDGCVRAPQVRVVCSSTCCRPTSTVWIYTAVLNGRGSRMRTNACVFLYVLHSEDQSVLSLQSHVIWASPDNVWGPGLRSGFGWNHIGLLVHQVSLCLLFVQTYMANQADSDSDSDPDQRSRQSSWARSRTLWALAPPPHSTGWGEYTSYMHTLIHLCNLKYVCSFSHQLSPPALYRLCCRTRPLWVTLILNTWTPRPPRVPPWVSLKAPSCRLSWPSWWTTSAAAVIAVHKLPTPSATLLLLLSTCRSCCLLSW